MKCPICNHDHSRVLRSGERRERQCQNCRHRWHTVELCEAVYADMQRAVAVVADAAKAYLSSGGRV